MSGAVPIGLGVVRISRDPGAEIVAFGLGSCVAVCVWDAAGPLAGMAHVVLPARPRGHPDGSSPNGKYADHAIPMLIEMLERAGGCPRRAVWKLAGGANVLRGSGLPPIGERNVEALYAVSRAHGLAIAAADTGGSQGRTVRLRVGDGTLRIRFATGEERYL